jgi:hypothetical protein
MGLLLRINYRCIVCSWSWACLGRISKCVAEQGETEEEEKGAFVSYLLDSRVIEERRSVSILMQKKKQTPLFSLNQFTNVCPFSI